MAHNPTGPSFDIRHIPFSHYGSWVDISPVTAQHTTERDLHLVSHQNGMHPVLGLVPLVPDSGDRARTVWQATPGRLTWRETDGSAQVELVYQGPDTLRLRGSGLDLSIAPSAAELTPFSGTYFFRDPVDGSFHFTVYETGRRYRVTCLDGAVADVAGSEALAGSPRRLRLTGAESWEAVIEEIDSARAPFAADRSHDEAAARSRLEFREFTDATTGWRTEQTPAAELAAYVVWSATVRPAGFLGRPAVLMSKHWMDKVWSWDHCFNALALAAGVPELAWDQFQLPFDHQDESGALPDSVTHSEVLYNFVKPPIHGWALRRLRERLPRPLTRDELAATYTRMRRWTDFWLNMRRAPGERLPHYHHGNDSGWDNASTFDPRRVVISADLSAFLVLQLHELSDLAKELELTEEAVRHARTADTVRDALLEELWTGERFCARSPHTGRTSVSRSLLGLMPIVLGEHLPADVSDVLADGIAGHLTEHGLATEHPDSPLYEADGYWRGPIWAPSTVLIEDGLRRSGHTRLADDISSRFRSLCEKSGFAENFDALTGTGLRDRAYTWTASSYLLLARDHVRRQRRGMD